MYVTPGSKLTEPGIRKYIRNELISWMRNDRFSKKQRKKYAQMLTMLHTNEFKSFSRMLIEINRNMMNHSFGKGVSILQSILAREPKGNLDSGSHYFDVQYYSFSGKRMTYVAPYRDDFAELIGMEQGRALTGWYFISGAIGMSRRLDATDSLFTLIHRMGGCYCQL